LFYKVATLFLFLALYLPAQDANKKQAIEDQFKITDTKTIEGDRDIVHVNDVPESMAPYHKMNLVDLNGKKFVPESDKVTVIEYWSINSAPDNLFWGRARELERKYANDEKFQLLSINYDFGLSGKNQREAVAKFLEKYTMPKNVLIDADDGLRDIFLVNGPVAYLLINHKNVYTYTFRGDDPASVKFFEHVDNAVEFKGMNPPDRPEKP